MVTRPPKTDRVSPEIEPPASSVECGSDIVDGIRRGLADAEAGRVVLHDDAMAEIDAVIDATEAERAGSV